MVNVQLLHVNVKLLLVNLLRLPVKAPTLFISARTFVPSCTKLWQCVCQLQAVPSCKLWPSQSTVCEMTFASLYKLKNYILQWKLQLVCVSVWFSPSYNSSIASQFKCTDFQGRFIAVLSEFISVICNSINFQCVSNLRLQCQCIASQYNDIAFVCKWNDDLLFFYRHIWLPM